MQQMLEHKKMVLTDNCNEIALMITDIIGVAADALALKIENVLARYCSSTNFITCMLTIPVTQLAFSPRKKVTVAHNM